MRREDLDAFSTAMDEMFIVLSSGRQGADGAQVAAWFRLFEPYTLAEVLGGMDGHMRRPLTPRTLPIPSDVIAQIEAQQAASDGRPGADEAWPIVLAADDEAATVVWTAEMAQAWGLARLVMRAGDEVGARVAFREAYNGLVAKARAAGRPVEWTATLGHDEAGRAAAIKAAQAQGRMPRVGVAADAIALPGARTVPELLLAAPETLTEDRRAWLQKLRDSVAIRVEPESQDATDRRRTDELRAAAAKAVDDYTRKAA